MNLNDVREEAMNYSGMTVGGRRIGEFSEQASYAKFVERLEIGATLVEKMAHADVIGLRTGVV